MNCKLVLECIMKKMCIVACESVFGLEKKLEPIDHHKFATDKLQN